MYLLGAPRVTIAYPSCCIVWFLGGLLGIQSLACAQDVPDTRPPAATEVEEIYIARSVRESRVAPTEFCAEARTTFSDATFEDQYTFRSTTARASDGRVIDSNAKIIGRGHACFGRTPNAAVLKFYADIHLGRTAFSGIGECHQARTDFPERGLNVFNCFLHLSGLPDEYIGGLLTTNSMSSLKTLGLESDPPGYTQSSIATIRLWKKRAVRR